MAKEVQDLEDRHQSTSSSVEKLAESLQKYIKQNQKQASSIDLEGLLKEVSNQSNETSSKVVKMQSQLTDLSKDFLDAQTTSRERMGKLETQCMELENKHEQHASMTSTHHDLHADKAEKLEEKIKALGESTSSNSEPAIPSADFSRLKGRVSSIETLTESHKTSIRNLDTEQTKLSVEIRGNLTKINKLTGRVDEIEGTSKTILSKAEQERQQLERKLDLELQRRKEAEETAQQAEQRRKEENDARERQEKERVAAEKEREKRLREEEELALREKQQREEDERRARKQKEAEALLKKPAAMLLEQQYMGASGALSSPSGMGSPRSEFADDPRDMSLSFLIEQMSQGCSFEKHVPGKGHQIVSSTCINPH